MITAGRLTAKENNKNKKEKPNIPRRSGGWTTNQTNVMRSRKPKYTLDELMLVMSKLTCPGVFFGLGFSISDANF